MLIVFEGMDASGKATQSRLLAEQLKGRRIEFPTYSTEPDALTGPVITTHLQGQWGTSTRRKVGENVVQYIPPQDPLLDPLVFQCIMTVNKYEMAPKIQRELDEDRHVILDRYWPSAYAYGRADGLDTAWLLRVHEMLPQPDICFLLDVDYETSMTRRPDRRDRYERKGKAYFDQVAANYRRLWLEIGPLSAFWAGPCSNKDTEWIVIEGRQVQEDVTRQVNDVLKTRGLL